MPPSDRIGTPEVLVDPDLPQVPPGQRDEALATARDVATETLHAHGALPSQSLEALCSYWDWRGRLCRLAYHPRMALVRMAIVIAAATITVVATGNTGPLQIYTAVALATALSVTADNLIHGRVQDADDAAIEEEVRLLLSQAGLHEILPTNGNADRA